MLRFLLSLLGLALVLIGILAGGCSLLFTPELFRNSEFGGSDILPIWGTGLVVGALGIWLGIRIFRGLGEVRPPAEVGDQPPVPPPAPSQDRTPDA